MNISKHKRKIAVVVVDRANYGRLKPVMQEINKNPDLELTTICAGTMVLERFGRPVDIVRKDGFEVDSEIFIELEGSNPDAASKTLGLAVVEFSTAFRRIHPDIVLIIGDRFESLGAMLAASYQNYCIAHIQGGEVSYSNDEMCRHVMTKLAHYHFPSTARAAMFLQMMGEDPKTIFAHGCPVVDVIRGIDLKVSSKLVENVGLGGPVDVTQDYFLVIFHPISTHFYSNREQVDQLLSSLQEFRMPTIWLWANIDPGSDEINKKIRMHREYVDSSWLQLVKNFPPEDFQRLLANAKVAIGNSSSFVRDSSVTGTPVVLLGERQKGREIAENVQLCPKMDKESITAAIRQQMELPRKSSTLYGEPGVSKKIVETLTKISLYQQKHLHYVKWEEKDLNTAQEFLRSRMPIHG